MGVAAANGEYIFILNPDTKLEKRSLDLLSGFLDKTKNAAIVAPTLVNKNGDAYPLQGSQVLTPIRAVSSFSFIKKLFPKNRILRKYWKIGTPKNKLRQVEVVPGSAFMVRSSVFRKIGGFDENFFMYFEDNDLCKRVVESGLESS